MNELVLVLEEQWNEMHKLKVLTYGSKPAARPELTETLKVVSKTINNLTN